MNDRRLATIPGIGVLGASAITPHAWLEDVDNSSGMLDLDDTTP
jgi:hypothetical protein